jgi:DHA2 family multidrug resistance protein
MGMLFTPLSTLALSDIPRHEMAQASGLFNAVRQIGGSFGVAAFGTLLVQRISFHTAVYGEALNQYSPAFKTVENGLRYFIQSRVGGTLAEAVQRSRFLVQSNLVNQSFVQSINDDFMIAVAATIFCLLPIFFIRTLKRGKAK